MRARELVRRRAGWVLGIMVLGGLGSAGSCGGGSGTSSGSAGQGGGTTDTGGPGGGGSGGAVSSSGGSGGAVSSSGGSGGTVSSSGGSGGTVSSSGGTTAIGSGGAVPRSGGATGAGGTAAAGGVSAVGGATASGGAVASGGTTSPGGATGNCPGSCPPPTPTSCSSPQVRVTEVNLGANLSYSSDERWVVPLAIAAKPGGGSLIAWVTGYSNYGSSTASQVHVGELDCEDKLVGTPFSFAGHDFQDLAADANGGVVVLTRDGQGTDAQHCGDVDNLCVTPSDRPGCYDMYMVRFDCAGAEQWAAKLTTTSASAPLYTSGSGTNLGVWWYQHHGRLAYDGTNYAAYFCDSITVTNNSCTAGAGKVDIHEGDSMQVVDPTGKVLSGHDSFSVGCSHSWTTRIVWDPRTSHFVTVCATDNNCRIARSPNYQTIKSATCDGTLFNGDIVNASDTGYWLAWSYQGAVRLEHFTTAASDKTVTTASTVQNPHLVAYGASRMLLTWKSGSGTAAQIYDSGSGEPVGEQLAIAVPDHPWQGWEPFPDGSVAWAGVASAASTIKIARVLPCSD